MYQRMYQSANKDQPSDFAGQFIISKLNQESKQTTRTVTAQKFVGSAQLAQLAHRRAACN